MCLSLQLSAVLLPGDHVVKVTVTNDLGNTSAVLNISVLYPVTVRRITAMPVTLTRPFVLEAVVSGDLDFELSVDFGDGSYVNSSTATLHPDILLTPLSNASGNGSAPVYLLKLRHLYATPGDYMVSLLVANRVLQVTNSLTATIADSDFNVTLVADCQSPVSSSSLITLRAAAAIVTDEDVSFNWTCDHCSYRPVVHGFVFTYVCSMITFMIKNLMYHTETENRKHAKEIKQKIYRSSYVASFIRFSRVKKYFSI